MTKEEFKEMFSELVKDGEIRFVLDKDREEYILKVEIDYTVVAQTTCYPIWQRTREW